MEWAYIQIASLAAIMALVVFIAISDARLSKQEQH